MATDTHARHAELGLGDDDVLAMYRQMLLARAVDERMWLMQRAGKIAFIISGQGHEGAQVAIAWPLRRGHDWMAPFYRSIASAMTFGMSAEDIITAHLAKADDVSSGGRQMPGHYGGAPYNIVSLSLAGGHAGAPRGRDRDGRLGPRRRRRGHDRASARAPANQGEIHEAMNFAGVHKLPVIFVCENNGYAISVPLDRQVGGGSVAARAAGYGMPGRGGRRRRSRSACYAAAKEAHDRARAGDGPTLIEARVVRLTSHSSDDDQRRYRDPAEVEALKEQRPDRRASPASCGEWGLLTDERSRTPAGRGQGGRSTRPAARRGRPEREPDDATTGLRRPIPAAARRTPRPLGQEEPLTWPS